MSVFIVLLRAIGPATHRVMSMAQWRDAVLVEGFVAPQTYVATGNMIVESTESAAEIATRMDAILKGLGLGPTNRAIVRTPEQLRALLVADPFPETTSTRPAEVGVHFFASDHAQFGWVTEYAGPERIHVAGQDLIIDYRGRGSSSGLPAVVERRSGLATARNWNTLHALAERSTARQP